LLSMIVSLLAVALGSRYVGLLAFLFIFPIWGLVEVLILGEIHSQLESHQRATIESLIVSFGVVVDTPIRLGFGRISEIFGIKAGYLFIAAALILYVPYFLWSRRKEACQGRAATT